MERSSQDRPSVALDLSQRNSLLASSASAAMDLVKQQQPGWHSRLTRSRRSTSRLSDLPLHKQASAPKPPGFPPGHSLPDAALRLPSCGARSRPLLSHGSRPSLLGTEHGSRGGGAEAGVVRPGAAAGVKARLEGGDGVGGGGRPEAGGRGVYRDRRPDSGRTVSRGEPVHAGGLRGGGAGSLWNPGLYDPDLSDSPSPDSSGEEEDSQSDSDVIFLVSTSRDDALVSQPDSASLCSSVDGDGVSSEDRGCFLLPRPLGSPRPRSSDSSSSSSDSAGDILPPSSLLLMSELTAVYDNSASSPVDISSDDDDDDSDVIEVPVTNERTRTTPDCPLSVRRSARPAKPVLSPTHSLWSETDTPRRTLYSRQAKRLSRNAIRSLKHNENYDSGDMMNSTEKQTSSEEEDEEEEEEEEEEAWAQAAVAATADWEDWDAESPVVGGAPSQSPSEAKPACRGLSSATRVRSQRPGQAASTAPTEAQAPPPAGVRKRLTKRKPCRRTAAAPDRPPKHSPPGRGGTRPPPARRRRKKPGGREPCASLFSPEELAVQLKYARRRSERRDSRPDGFRPFVRVRWRECTVVNSREEEALGAGRGGGRAQRGGGGGGGSAGLVPRTSCHQLGRLSSQSRAEAPQVCCLCGGPANATALGDLHGPYYRSGPRDDRGARRRQNGPPSDPRDLGPAAENGVHGLSNGRCHGNEAEEDGRAGAEDDDEAAPVGDRDGFAAAPSAERPRTDESPPPAPPSPGPPGERWVHEDCGVWSAGVFLVKGRLYGLEEAAWLARETVCTTCHRAGATMGCFLKGCPTKYHYRCAVQSGCALNEENFSMRCPKHKNKAFRGVTRLHNR